MATHVEVDNGLVCHISNNGPRLTERWNMVQGEIRREIQKITCSRIWKARWVIDSGASITHSYRVEPMKDGQVKFFLKIGFTRIFHR